jgi:hypothetical protein
VSLLLTTFDVDEDGICYKFIYMVVTALSLVILRAWRGTGHSGAGLR